MPSVDDMGSETPTGSELSQVSKSPEQREPFDITPADVGRYVRDKATGHVGRVERDGGNGWLYPTLRYEWKTFRDEFEYVDVILPPSAAPEQREPNWSSGMKKDDAGRYVHGACRIDGDGFCVTHQSANWAECANAKMPPPSAAPSQPQQQRECTHHRMMPHCYECEQEAAAGIDGMPNMPDNPSQPQQKDLVAASVFEAEPGQPSNPAAAIETQHSINQWQREQFPTAKSTGIVGHLREEFNEFLDANAYASSAKEPAEEAADMVILLYCWADHNGVDLHAEIDRKMAKNRARKWNIQPDGTGRHVIASPLTGPTNEGHGR